MNAKPRPRRLADDFIYELAISRWEVRYGFGWMMPTEPGLDEFATVELIGVVQQPETLRGRRAAFKLQHESFLDELDDIERNQTSVGHLTTEEWQVTGAIIIPFRSMSSIITLASSDRLRSLVLRGTDLIDGTSLIVQLALDTRQLASDDPEIEER